MAYINAMLIFPVDLRHLLFPALKWVGVLHEQESILSSLTRFSIRVGWVACCQVTDMNIPGLVAELEHFDFSGLHEAPTGFVHFLHWFSSLVR